MGLALELERSRGVPLRADCGRVAEAESWWWPRGCADWTAGAVGGSTVLRNGGEQEQQVQVQEKELRATGRREVAGQTQWARLR